MPVPPTPCPGQGCPTPKGLYAGYLRLSRSPHYNLFSPQNIIYVFFYISHIGRLLVPRGIENNANAQYCGENKAAL